MIEQPQTTLAQEFVLVAKHLFDGCPLINSSFFDSFEYTTTGKNFCHPRVVGLLAKAAWSLPITAVVELDVRFNLGKMRKFQPDIAVRDAKGAVRLVVDFESPNSSDSRIPDKDLKAFVTWAKASGEPAEYLVITSLPSRRTPGWELRWAAKDYYNHDHQGKLASIRENPFRYWYGFYRCHFDADWKALPISLANFNGRSLSLVRIDTPS